MARERVAEASLLVLRLQAIRTRTLPLPVKAVRAVKAIKAVKAVKREAVAKGIDPFFSVANTVW